ncbi:MAG: hypothetical protein LBQ50_02885 [Planctomycetaceae bacterium]|jgi:hypothetical protein|nr:hypothetical protein [Planctomycetaceae bacterium]
MSESNNEVLYAFYDKTKETQNNGWVWFHRELALRDIQKFHRDYLQDRNKDILAKDPSNNRGFMRFNNWKVLFGFYSAVEDEKKRKDNWVLLTAWIPEDSSSMSKCQGILDGNVFKHIADRHFDLPQEELSVWDYDPNYTKLAYDGSTLDNLTHEDARKYITEIENIGKVDIIFYRENPDGSAVIETKKNQ